MKAKWGRRGAVVGIVLAFFCFLAFVCVGAACGATIAERVSETVLPNGLKVLLLENHIFQ